MAEGSPASSGTGESRMSIKPAESIGTNTCGHLNGRNRLCIAKQQEETADRFDDTNTIVFSSNNAIYKK